MTLLVIRHAHAGDRVTWAGADDRRPLSAKGERQATGLVDLLSDLPIERILTSPYVRCVQTVQPLSAARGITVEHVDDLREGAPASDVRQLLHQVADRDVALCSHGDVIGDLVGRLRAGGVDLGAHVDWQKASTWILTWNHGRVSAGRYRPPPPA